MNPRKDLSSKLAALQEKGGGGLAPGRSPVQGKKYWRTLEELADTEAFHELLRQEYPEQAPLWPQALSRRQFLSLMGASLALNNGSAIGMKLNGDPYLCSAWIGSPPVSILKMSVRSSAVGL